MATAACFRLARGWRSLGRRGRRARRSLVRRGRIILLQSCVMSQESWEELERKGWRKRISDNNGRVSYLRPREGGRVMVVNQRRDLRDGEESLGDILWPPANKRPMQEEEPEGEEDPVIEEAREVEEAAEVMERAEVREEVLEDSEDGAEDGEDKVEHKVELLNMAGRLKDVSRRDIDIISTGEMMFELDKAMQEHDNPLRQELPLDSKKNFFVEVLKFGLSRAEHLVYTILKLTTTMTMTMTMTMSMTARKATEWLRHKMHLYWGSRLVIQ